MLDLWTVTKEAYLFALRSKKLHQFFIIFLLIQFTLVIFTSAFPDLFTVSRLLNILSALPFLTVFKTDAPFDETGFRPYLNTFKQPALWCGTSIIFFGFLPLYLFGTFLMSLRGYFFSFSNSVYLGHATTIIMVVILPYLFAKLSLALPHAVINCTLNPLKAWGLSKQRFLKVIACLTLGGLPSAAFTFFMEQEHVRNSLMTFLDFLTPHLFLGNIFILMIHGIYYFSYIFLLSSLFHLYKDLQSS